MTLQEIRQLCEEYAQEYQAGRISAEEYKDLLIGMEISKAVTMNAEELQEKEELHSYINATINVLSLV
jgi:hypothetical protein